jgi:AcrR family transcriptional regulator
VPGGVAIQRRRLVFFGMTSTQPTRRDGEATRQRLLRAALDLYTTVGFRATTTPAIAARAGVAEGTIYRHFSGKEHLLNEVFRGAQRWGTTIVQESEAEQAAPGRLRQIAGRLLETASNDAATTRMLLRHRDEQHLDERSREAEREFRDALQHVVAAGKSDGAVRAGPADLWTDVWLALVAFVVERVGARQWSPDAQPVGMALDAAWDAIAAR